MLYLVGGPSRAGKTTLANRMLRRHSVPWFSLDYLASVFHHGFPALGINHEQDGDTRAALLWPGICKTLEVIAVQEPRYLIEGDCLLPADIGELRDRNIDFRACWLGYAEADVEIMLATLRRIPGESNNWIEWHDDDYVRRLVVHGIERSHGLKAECERLGLAYVETSQDFPLAIEQAVDRLVNGTGT